MVQSIFSIKINDTGIGDTLSEIEAKVQDLREAFDLIGEYWVGEIDEQFRQEVDPYGNPWQKLSEFTLKKKQQEGKILKILQRTGYMRSTVNYQSTANQLSIGLTDKKALKHQIGEEVPKREILGINERNKRDVIEILTEYLVSIT